MASGEIGILARLEIASAGMKPSVGAEIEGYGRPDSSGPWLVGFNELSTLFGLYNILIDVF